MTNRDPLDSNTGLQRAQRALVEVRVTLTTKRNLPMATLALADLLASDSLSTSGWSWGRGKARYYGFEFGIGRGKRRFWIGFVGNAAGPPILKLRDEFRVRESKQVEVWGGYPLKAKTVAQAVVARLHP